MANAPGTTASPSRRSTVDQRELDQLVRGEHSDPHRILGVHGLTVRAFRPDAKAMTVVLPDGNNLAMEQVHPGGLFEADLPSDEVARTYRLCADYGNGPGFIYDDPYKA